ncbi:MAG: Rieske 2Fe-2S domain-containing protein [Cyclobacteriaceae bacterium]
MANHLIFDSRAEADKTIPLNTIRKIKLEGKLYALAKTPNGFKTFSLVCPHAGADLSQGKINHLGEVVCPLHAYIFNLLDGEEMSRRCLPVKVYSTFWDDEKLYVAIK